MNRRSIRVFGSKQHGRAAVAGIGAAVALLTLSACGGSAEGSGNSEIPIMGMFPLTGANGIYTPWANAVRAAVAESNASGELGTRRIKLIMCDTGESANSAVACGQKAVQNHVVGVIKMGGVEAPVKDALDNAHIARFNTMSDPVDFTDPHSYSTAFASGSVSQGMIGLAKKLNCDRFAIVREDPGPATEVETFRSTFLSAAKEAGVNADYVQVPPSAVDLSSYVAKALTLNPTCMLLEGYGDAPMIGLMKGAIALAPSSTTLITVPSLVSSTAVKSLGSDLDRFQALNFAWPMSSAADHPGVQKFISVMKKYAPKPFVLDNNSQLMWSSTNALIHAISQVKGSVTAKSVEDALNTFHNYDTEIGPPVSYDQPMTDPVPPRVFAPYAIQVKYVNGEQVPVGTFFNDFTGEPVPEQ